MGGRYSLISILNTNIGTHRSGTVSPKNGVIVKNGDILKGKSLNGAQSQQKTQQVALFMEPGILDQGNGDVTVLTADDVCDSNVPLLAAPDVCDSNVPLSTADDVCDSNAPVTAADDTTGDSLFIPPVVDLPRNEVRGHIGVPRFEAHFSDSDTARLKIKDLFPGSQLVLNPQEYGLPQRVRRFRHYYYLKGVRKARNGNRKLDLTTVATTTRLFRTYRITEAELIVLITKITRITRRTKRVEMKLTKATEENVDVMNSVEPIQSFSNENSRILHSNKLIAFEYTPPKNSIISCY